MSSVRGAGYVWLADDIGSLGGAETYANDINNNGEIVGTAVTAGGLRVPFIFTSSKGMVDLNALIDPQELSPGPDGIADSLIWGNAINDRGQIVAKGWNSYLLTPVPEPSSNALLPFAAPSLIGWWHRKRRFSNRAS